jgi:cell division protein FtsI/penicillin-binding protein 2
MPHQPHAGRIKLLAGLMVSLWLIVAARLVHVQQFQNRELSAFATRQREIEVEVPARPADIVDRHGKLLASTIVMSSLFVDPTRLDVETEFITGLSAALNLDANHLVETIANARQRNRRFVWLKRRLSDDEVDAVEQLEWPAGSHGFRDEFQRCYPQGHLAAHVLGLRDIDGRGRGGVEQSFNYLIVGRPGRRRLVRDAMGRIVEVSFDPESEPQRFDEISLTIDLAVQMFAEQGLDAIIEQWSPRSASVIVMDPRVGDILAMASRPTYSPDDPSDVPADAWKNQAIGIVYEPGSTLKPFIVAWALEQGVISRDEVFHCENGEYLMGRRVLHDHHSYGKLSVTDILVKSSNIGMAKIGERLGNAGLYRATTAFGFGNRTGIDLPGELSGLLRPLKKWNSYSTGSIPMGQELAVTPLQLITAHAALANGGRLMTPRILNGVHGHRHSAESTFVASTDEPDHSGSTTIVTPTVQTDIAKWIVEVPMTEVVKRGTGTKARLDAYEVFGKTGTSQKMNPNGGGYSDTLHTASFICGAPAHDPRVLVLVVVDEPRSGRTHYGGVIAAPPARQILNRTLLHLGVSPDAEIRTADKSQ